MEEPSFGVIPRHQSREHMLWWTHLVILSAGLIIPTYPTRAAFYPRLFFPGLLFSLKCCRAVDNASNQSAPSA